MPGLQHLRCCGDLSTSRAGFELPDKQSSEKSSAKTPSLLSKSLFNVAYLLLNLSADLLAGSLRFEVRIVGRLADLFLNFSLQFVGRALDFVLRTVFHVDDLLSCRTDISILLAEGRTFLRIAT